MDLIFGVDRLNVNGGVLLWFVLNCFAERPMNGDQRLSGSLNTNQHYDYPKT